MSVAGSLLETFKEKRVERCKRSRGRESKNLPLPTQKRRLSLPSQKMNEKRKAKKGTREWEGKRDFLLPQKSASLFFNFKQPIQTSSFFEFSSTQTKRTDHVFVFQHEDKVVLMPVSSPSQNNSQQKAAEQKFKSSKLYLQVEVVDSTFSTTSHTQKNHVFPQKKESFRSHAKENGTKLTSLFCDPTKLDASFHLWVKDA